MQMDADIPFLLNLVASAYFAHRLGNLWTEMQFEKKNCISFEGDRLSVMDSADSVSRNIFSESI